MAENSDVQPKAATRSAVTSACAAVVAAGVALTGVIVSNTAAHESQLRSARVEAYSNYAADLATFNQLMWANVYWAGTDKEETPEKAAARDMYWDTVVPLQNNLEAGYYAAAMFAVGSKTEQALNAIHGEQLTMQKQFSCLADPNTNDCVDGTASAATIDPRSAAEIEAAVEAWSDRHDDAMEEFITVAAKTQVQ